MNPLKKHSAAIVLVCVLYCPTQDVVASQISTPVHFNVVSKAFVERLAVTATDLPSQGQTIQLSNISHYMSPWWNWTVFVNAPQEIVQSIAYVEYRVPGWTSGEPPIIRVHKTTDPRFPFSYSAASYGTFEIKARVVFKNGRQKVLTHMLVFAGEAAGCGDSFVLQERHYYRVPTKAFAGRLIAYVGTVHSTIGTKHPNAGYSATFPFVLLTNAQSNMWASEGVLSDADFGAKSKIVPQIDKWSVDFEAEGDSIAVQFEGQSYRVEVLHTQFSSLGDSKITLHICEK